MPLKINAYLNRISFEGKPIADLETLKLLHRQHLYTVPFENIYNFQGITINLDLDWLEQKIVVNNRGGFCYELNGLFFELLRIIGFDVKMVSARVFEHPGVPGSEFDHLALIVSLEDDWLVDIGFGGSFVEPLRISPGLEQKDPTGLYKIEQIDAQNFEMMQARDGNNFESKYRFSIKSRKLLEFGEMCTYHQTSPRSSFTRKRLCTVATQNGRKTLSGTEFIITKNGRKSKIQLKGEVQFNQILMDEFGIQSKGDKCQYQGNLHPSIH
jgi:N-hydroxyarylamine O-acetyltransferase